VYKSPDFDRIGGGHAQIVGWMAGGGGGGRGGRGPPRQAKHQRAGAARGQLTSGQHRVPFFSLLCHPVPPASLFSVYRLSSAALREDLRFCVRFVVRFLDPLLDPINATAPFDSRETPR